MGFFTLLFPLFPFMTVVHVFGIKLNRNTWFFINFGSFLRKSDRFFSLLKCLETRWYTQERTLTKWLKFKYLFLWPSNTAMFALEADTAIPEILGHFPCKYIIIVQLKFQKIQPARWRWLYSSKYSMCNTQWSPYRCVNLFHLLPRNFFTIFNGQPYACQNLYHGSHHVIHWLFTLYHAVPLGFTLMILMISSITFSMVMVPSPPFSHLLHLFLLMLITNLLYSVDQCAVSWLG